MGAKIYDLLRQEQDLRDARSKALRLLDQLSTSNMSGKDEVHKMVQRKLRALVEAATDNVGGLEKQARALESDQKSLSIKIKKRSADLERSEKRLKSLQTVKPAFMEEYEKLEVELQRCVRQRLWFVVVVPAPASLASSSSFHRVLTRIYLFGSISCSVVLLFASCLSCLSCLFLRSHYEVYLERFRNLAYLEHELDEYNKSEQEKLNEGKARLEILQRRLHDQERKILRGKDAVDLDEDVGRGRPVAAAARREGILSDGRGRSRALADHSSESEPSGISDSGSLSDSGSSHVSMDDDGGRGRRGGRAGRSRSRSLSDSDDLLDDDDDLSGSDGSRGSRGRRRGGSFSGTDSDNEF